MNHRRVHVWEKDITRLSVAAVRRQLKLKKGQLDLLAGCPPCQGFSAMRTLNGSKTVADDRNDLVFEVLRFIRGLSPKTIMMENVPGLADDARIDRFCDEITVLGYSWEKRVLDAAEYGVPQRRRRMIFLASKVGPIEFAQPSDRRKSVRETIADLVDAGISGDPLHDFVEARSDKVVRLISRIPKDGGSRRDLGAKSQLPCHRSFNGFTDVYGRMRWDDVSPTITGGFVNPSKGRFLHPEKDRCVTLREGALLQGFPQTYKFSLDEGKFATAQMIGNALPPEFIRRHAARIAKQLKTSRE
jgi:DNA (cytosine-5)-methyltransferase 1